MSDVIQIPTRMNEIDKGLFVCADNDWMLECDGCGRRMPPVEDIRGAGDLGLLIARDLAKSEGWSSEPATDRDTCPKCKARPEGAESEQAR